MPDWQPIETAPKDGQPLDLWIATYSKKTGALKTGHRVVDAFYQPMPHNGWRWARYGSFSYGDDPFDVTTEYTDDREERITHWVRFQAPLTPDKDDK